MHGDSCEDMENQRIYHKPEEQCKDYKVHKAMEAARCLGENKQVRKLKIRNAEKHQALRRKAEVKEGEMEVKKKVKKKAVAERVPEMKFVEESLSKTEP